MDEGGGECDISWVGIGAGLVGGAGAGASDGVRVVGEGEPAGRDAVRFGAEGRLVEGLS